MVNFQLFSRVDLTSTPDLQVVKKLSDAVLGILNQKSVIEAISKAHVFGASSHSIQKAILPHMLELGFTSEKKQLFSEYKVGGLRPDYYKPLSKGGILFEVERGKTIANNMDLLDVWKTHICKEANHLFLLVPTSEFQRTKMKPKSFHQLKTDLRHFSMSTFQLLMLIACICSDTSFIFRNLGQKNIAPSAACTPELMRSKPILALKSFHKAT